MTPYRPKDPLAWRIMDRWGRAPLGCLVLPPLMLVTVVLFPFFRARQRRRIAYFHRVLKQQGRIIPWREFLDRANQKPGSVIIEVGNKRQTRFWWSDDRLLALAPMKPPELSDLNIIAYGGAHQHPFIEWCYDSYLSLETGSASYIDDGAAAEFETFPFDRANYVHQMKQRFPKQDVIVVTFFDVRYG